MGSKIRIRVISTDKGCYLEKHRKIVESSINQIIEASEWDDAYWVADLRMGNLFSGFSDPIPVLICKHDCSIL